MCRTCHSKPSMKKIAFAECKWTSSVNECAVVKRATDKVVIVNYQSLPFVLLSLYHHVVRRISVILFGPI